MECKLSTYGQILQHILYAQHTAVLRSTFYRPNVRTAYTIYILSVELHARNTQKLKEIAQLGRKFKFSAITSLETC